LIKAIVHSWTKLREKQKIFLIIERQMKSRDGKDREKEREKERKREKRV